VLRANLKWNLAARSIGSYLAVLIVMTGIASCDRAVSAPDKLLAIAPSNPALSDTDGPLSEVNIPASISQLAPSLTKFHPQVQILSPQSDEVLTDDRVTVKLKVRDLPISKQPELGLGNHLQVILDKQTAESVYDLSQPLVFKNLAAGTHTLRVFAARPWHESFKNDGAFALVTFHVLTKTAENNPDPHQPLLTYSQPIGRYSAEPILLDYYLTNLPSPPITNDSVADLPDWRIRVTVNEQTFILGGIDGDTAAMTADRWTPVYLQGFKLGKNWVRLELIDDRGHPIPNVYNDTVEIFTYQPESTDPLARLVRGEIPPELALTLLDPNRIAIKPTPAPSASVPPTPVPMPVPRAIVPSPTSQPSPSPIAIVPPIVVKHSPTIAPPIVVQPSPDPVTIVPPIVIQPSPLKTPAPVVQPSPDPVTIVPPIVIQPSPSPIVKIVPPATPTPTPQPQHPIAIVKPLPIEIVPPSVATPPASIITPPLPSQTATTKPLPKKAVQQDESAVTVLVLPRSVVDALIKPLQTPTGTPTATAILLPQSVVDELVKAAARGQRQSSPVTATTAIEPAPQLDTKPTTTWQTQTIELFDLARAKIRTFTNTIPSKAQRFGDNVRVWLAKTIDNLRQE
jgi:hypothetical protein